MRKVKTTKEVILKFISIHGDKYNYSNTVYTRANKKLEIICPIHGKFLITYNSHCKGHGCHQCGKITRSNSIKNSQENIINKIREKYGNRYDLTLINYKGVNNKIKLICPDHGEFEITPNNLLRAKTIGCQKCGNDNCGWTRSRWKKACKGKTAKLYIIKCWNDEEVFYKIGRTSKDIKYRFSGKYMPYDFEILEIIESENSDEIFDLENFLHKKNKHYKYLPKIKFGGRHECFTNYEL